MTSSAAAGSADTPTSDATVDDLRRWARRRIRETDRDDLDPREATTLIGHALGWNDAQVYARGDRVPGPEDRRRFEDLVDRRVQGEPFAYLSGTREFYGREFEVDPRVLIPRPETEHLIEACLELRPRPRRILDIGTGSGCIALTLALELPTTTVLACDVSIGALAVARRNLVRFARHDSGLTGRFHLFASDLLAAVGPGRTPIDTLVSNPPYIARGERLPPTVADYEPDVALYAGPEGTEAYRRILSSAAPRAGTTRILLELGADQATTVDALGRAVGFEPVALRRDLAGWQRILILDRAAT